MQDALEGLSVNSSNIAIPRRIKEENAESTSSTPNRSSKGTNSRSRSPDNNNNNNNRHKSQSDSISTPEAAPRPRMSRKASQKTAPRPVTLFNDHPDVTSDSKDHFELIENCMYGSKTLGSSKQDALDCDCSEEWRRSPIHLYIYITFPARRAGESYRMLMCTFRRWYQPCLCRRFMHQPCHQNGMCRPGMQLW